MGYKLVVFDLDGTLLDTLGDLVFSANEALAAHGMPVRTPDEIRAFTGSGVRMLIERAVPEGTDAAVAETVLGDFLRSYVEHDADTTRPYPGIPELLDTLREKGIRCAVVSNKADFAVQELVACYFPGQIDLVLGEREGLAKKPATDMLDFALAQLGAARDEMVYVGDSEIDFDTAANFGCDLILCSWGFRSRDELRALGPAVVADSPGELLHALLG
ncbi:HAD family hydrolase [Coriobacteriales bacterium OH1046]|nr:HAD family hydrolase [Coriobacteriales bacterium OH1046]